MAESHFMEYIKMLEEENYQMSIRITNYKSLLTQLSRTLKFNIKERDGSSFETLQSSDWVVDDSTP